MNDEVYFWYADKHRSLLQVDTINLGLCNQACPKYPKVFFSSTNKQESFLQTDSITLGV